MATLIDMQEEGLRDCSDSRLSPCVAKKRLGDFSLKAWDGHAHSYYSSDVKEREEFDPVNLFFEGLRRGMDFVTLTDHDSYEQNEVVMCALKNRGDLLGRFVPGTEFTVDDKSLGHVIHVNVYMHTKNDFDDLCKLRNNVNKFVDYCVRKSLPYQYNHPIWFELKDKEKISDDAFQAILEYAKLFPVIEVSNSNRAVYENFGAEVLAKILGKGFTSTSDGHFGDLGAKGYTLAKGETFREFWRNVSRGDSWIVKQNVSTRLMREYVMQTIDHMAYPRKIKRVGGKFMIDTGNKTVGSLIRFFDRFPMLLRPLLPYVRRRIRKSSSVDRYVSSQNVIGRKAIAYFESTGLFTKDLSAVREVYV